MSWLRELAYFGLTIFAFHACSMDAQADVRTPNVAGGLIILGTDSCDVVASYYEARTTNKAGQVIRRGCWTLNGIYVHVHWADGAIAIYPAELFLPVRGKDRESPEIRARAIAWSERERSKEAERVGRSLAACERLSDHRERRECEFWMSL